MSKPGFALVSPPARLLRWHQQGFSLVELMVAITIGFVVVAAVGYVYLSARQSFRTTDNMSRMQENARLAIETLARDVRMAGYIGCGNLQTMAVNTITNPPVQPISAANAITGQDFAAAATFPGTTIMRPAGDTISVMAAFGGSVNLDPAQPGGVNFRIVGNPMGIMQGDVVLLSDCGKATTLRVTNSPGASGLVTITHGGNSNIITNGLGGQYLPNGVVTRMERFTYFIGINEAGKRALYRTNVAPDVAQVTTVELVEDVWDMQIEYGRDTNADGAADIYGDATEVGANWAQVVSARINLLLVSPENNIVASPQTYNFNKASWLAMDRRMYQSFNATIGIRNRLP